MLKPDIARFRQIDKGHYQILSVLVLFLITSLASENASAQESAETLETIQCVVDAFHISEPFAPTKADSTLNTSQEDSSDDTQNQVPKKEVTLVKEKKMILRCSGKKEIFITLEQRQRPSVVEVRPVTLEKWQTLFAQFPSLKIVRYIADDGLIYDSRAFNVNFNCNILTLEELGHSGLIQGLEKLITAKDWDYGSALNTIAKELMTPVYVGSLEQFEALEETPVLQLNDVVLYYAEDDEGNKRPIQGHSGIVVGFDENGHEILLNKFGEIFSVIGNTLDVGKYYNMRHGTKHIEIYRVETPVVIEITPELEEELRLQQMMHEIFVYVWSQIQAAA